MKVYISIPITGHDIKDVEQRISRAKEALRNFGHEPVSPLDPEVNNDRSKPYGVLLGNDIAALLTCDAVLLLDGWTASNGCSLEFAAAKIYGKEIMFENQLNQQDNESED